MQEVARRVRNKNPNLSHYPDWLLYHMSTINPMLLLGKKHEQEDAGWARLRFEVLRRDGFRCRYCGARPIDGVRLTVDHIKPRSKGGTDDIENLLTACSSCNEAKADSELTDNERKSLGIR